MFPLQKNGIDMDQMGRDRRDGDRIRTGWEGTGGMGIDTDQIERDRRNGDRYGPDGKGQEEWRCIRTGWEGTGGMGTDTDQMGRDRSLLCKFHTSRLNTAVSH